MAYSFQTFSLNQILTSAQVNQLEANIRDHVHGSAGVAQIDAVGIAGGNVTDTEFDYLNGVTSSIQTQFDNKPSFGYTTSGTTASLGAGAASSTEVITHSLGTDNVEVFLIAKGSVDIDEWVASIYYNDGMNVGVHGAAAYADAPPLGLSSAAGTIYLKFINTHTSSQTISYRVIVRKLAP